MGKKSRKLRSPKYARKAAAFRENVARLNGRRVIQIDLNTGEEVEDNVIVVTNTEPEPEKTETPVLPRTELQLETVKIEEPPIPNALKHIEEEKPKTTRKRKAPAKKTTTSTTKKSTSTTRRRRTTKTKTDA